MKYYVGYRKNKIGAFQILAATEHILVAEVIKNTYRVGYQQRGLTEEVQIVNELEQTAEWVKDC